MQKQRAHLLPEALNTLSSTASVDELLRSLALAATSSTTSIGGKSSKKHLVVFFARGKRGLFGGELSLRSLLLRPPEIDSTEIVFFTRERPEQF